MRRLQSHRASIQPCQDRRELVAVAWSPMESPSEPPPPDLSLARMLAEEAAGGWGLTLEPPFAMANVSYVAPAGTQVVKVSWEGDDESLHEPDALELWDGDGAVRLVDRSGRALLEERAIPGTDLSVLGEADATVIAVDLAHQLWRPAREPFRPVASALRVWIAGAERQGSELAPLARELLADFDFAADWIVHGDFHHHNILRHGDRYVAIDPKPYAADREYDVPSYLWNPMTNQLDDPDLVESRIAAFVASGLDDFRIRAWTVIRGAYLRPSYVKPIRAVLGRRQ
jgi:streptomycin 6-kinase